MTPRLRTVAKRPSTPLSVDAARSWRVYPSAELAAKWLAAVHWMQARPRGSIWILDTNKPAPKWRSLPESER